MEKVFDVVGLYLNPPEAAVVLCVDEKSQVQALARSQPAFPMMPGMPEKRTHDYVRHGTTSLFAAFNTADGTVISSMHRRHRTIEFKKFLTKIDAEVPAELDVHLVCDNYGTHKSPAIKKWLAAHPRFHVHYTPTYSSWINQVERWFAYLTDDLLRRSDHRSVQALERDIRAWVKAWNDNPQTLRLDQDRRTDPRLTRHDFFNELTARDTRRPLKKSRLTWGAWTAAVIGFGGWSVVGFDRRSMFRGPGGGVGLLCLVRPASRLSGRG